MNFEKILEQFQTDLENYRNENENKHPMNQDFWFSQFENDIDEIQEIVDGMLGFDFQEAYNAQYDPETVTTPEERDRLAFQQKMEAKG